MNVDLEYNDQKVQRNNIVFMSKAQIGIDALQGQEKENIIGTIHCLEEFPSCSTIQICQVQSTPYIMVLAGVYRIVFTFKPGEITIVDIVNYNRIKILFESVKEAQG